MPLSVHNTVWELIGKKGKKKARSGYKERQERRVSTASQTSVGEESIPTIEAVNDGLLVVKERKVCAYLDKGIDLVKVSSRIGSIEGVRCEDCREGVVDRRASKGRGKHGKKKGGGSVDTKSENKAIWVCLEFGHFPCGGIGLLTTPQSHAVRHARQNRHPLAIQFENLHLFQLKNWRKMVNTKICRQAPQFRGYQQHDCHELLRCLLDGLCTGELSARKQNTWENGILKNLGPTFVDITFGGQLSSTVSCLECGHSSTVFEPFLDLSLPVPTKKPPSKRAQSISRAKKPKLPPKRSARIRREVNDKGADYVESESVPIPSAGGASSCHIESSLPLSDEAGDALADPTLPESVGPITVAEKESSVLLNPLTTEEFEKKPFLKNVRNKEEDSLDNLTWLDFLEPDPVTDGHDTASKANETAVIHDSGKKVAVQNDASLQDGIESSKKVHSLCMVETSGSSSNLDSTEPATLLDEHDWLQKLTVSVTQDYRGKDAVENDVFLQNMSGPSAQICSLQGILLRTITGS
ncbi:Ubiquitin carboxyl-terminal hydrolase 1 [Camellia lanceoleosa]|uniref:Ubiquitin carboxyl-terminal hydrolase 1 n=1 Tax=Camellia lanceoleosa TaxID=1840588 RepID=A0ACC0GS86_9ERIC|nr:Ubiquitin carboxyl-terminal hydrolase 1 [Camellia lanceoleosa]